jgi:hypothetical protein
MAKWQFLAKFQDVITMADNEVEIMYHDKSDEHAL